MCYRMEKYFINEILMNMSEVDMINTLTVYDEEGDSKECFAWVFSDDYQGKGVTEDEKEAMIDFANENEWGDEAIAAIEELSTDDAIDLDDDEKLKILRERKKERYDKLQAKK